MDMYFLAADEDLLIAGRIVMMVLPLRDFAYQSLFITRVSMLMFQYTAICLLL
jgi:hypothetical protein